MEVSVVMPCLNEAETLAICIKKARQCLSLNNVSHEIIIADNGSTDGSQQIAKKNSAVVVNVVQRGYGAALQSGIKAAKGQYIIMGDSDDSYDFLNMMPFIIKLREGYQLVMGNRFAGGIDAGAMPFLHRYLGNPVLSFIGRLFFRIPIRDFHCGLRGFTKEAFEVMHLKTTGMEFASEMVVKASLHNLKITEVPTTLSPDGRTRAPHLNTWTDGWRHLRFLFLYAPKWLFLYPGLFLMFTGLILSTLIIIKPINIFNIQLDVFTLSYAALAVFIGFQFAFFYAFSKVFAAKQGFLPPSKRLLKFLQVFSLEKGLITGLLIGLAGLGLSFYAIKIWQATGFGALDSRSLLRVVAPAIFLLALSLQIFLCSFFISFLQIES